MDPQAANAPQPSAPRPGRIPRRVLRVVILLLVVLAMLFFFVPLALFSAGIQGDVERLQGDLQLIQATAAALQTPAQSVQGAMSDLDAIQASLDSLKAQRAAILESFANWPKIMAVLADYDSNQLELTSLEQEDRVVTLKGRAVNDTAVVSYARVLETSGLFSRVIVRSIRAIGTPFITTTVQAPGVVVATDTPVPSATPTQGLRDEYEVDDYDPQPIFLGVPQTHNFYPLYDIDAVTFLAKAGRYYRISTSALAPGVDTFVTVSIGAATYTNDDRAPTDISSEVVVRGDLAGDVDAIVTIANRGQFGGDQTYAVTVQEIIPTATLLPTSTGNPTATGTTQPSRTTTPTITLAPTPSFTPDLRDSYEPDDVTPKTLVVGESQLHSFYPNNDVDKLVFLAKAGRTYQVETTDLTLGVDTHLFCTVAGVSYENDDRAQGDVSSMIEFYVNVAYDVEAYVEVVNRGQYGTEYGYRISLRETITGLTPTPSLTPDFRDAYEPDDTTPNQIAVGETQSHTFYPEGDIDTVSFLAKAGRSYRVSTSGLALGTDTRLVVNVGGVIYENDDRQPADPSSDLTFYVAGTADLTATVEVHNRGQYGPGYMYQLSVVELAAPAEPTATPVVGDAYEPDDVNPKVISLGEVQAHTFEPDADIDKVTFLAKPGRWYRVSTSDLAMGVDTHLFCTAGSVSAQNDDRVLGDPSSEVAFQVAEAEDVMAVAEVHNKGQYGADMGYNITVVEAVLTPVPTATSDVLGDEYEPDDSPKIIAVGETQTHTFHPEADVDRVTFLGKAGRQYRVFTSGLVLGVDTLLTISGSGIGCTSPDAPGGDSCASDDVAAGDLSSEVNVTVSGGVDTWITVQIQNREQFGPTQAYSISVKEVVTSIDSPASHAAAPRRVPGLAAMRSWRTSATPPAHALVALPPQRDAQWLPLPARVAAQDVGAVEFVILLTLKTAATPQPTQTEAPAP